MFEVLSIQARNKLARTMKAKAKMIAKKRERAMKKKANPEKLKKRAQKKAVDFIAKKILKDKDRSDLGQAGKASLEKKIKSINKDYTIEYHKSINPDLDYILAAYNK